MLKNKRNIALLLICTTALAWFSCKKESVVLPPLDFNYFPTEFVGLRIAGNLGYLEGSDEEAPSKGGAEMDRRERNLNFKTKIGFIQTKKRDFKRFFDKILSR